MVVTDIVEISKKQCKIMIDDEFAFVLYKGELPLYQIKKQGILTRENYHKIVDEVLVKRAKLRAMNLLKSRPYTEKKLIDKLRSGHYPQTCIDAAITYVKSYGYINDEQYAMDYLFYHGSSLNRMQLFQKLRAKGIKEEVIVRCYEAYCQDGNAPDEEALIYRFIRKKGYVDSLSDIENDKKIKLIKSLLQKGFSYDKICCAFARYGEIAEEMQS